MKLSRAALGVSAFWLAFWLAEPTAHAVRPFVTDDARIIDVGQLEMEMWPELVFHGGRVHPGFHWMGGATFTEWLELIVGTGVGIGHDDRGRHFTLANPVIQPKLLLWRAAENGVPGLALGLGVTLPIGVGEMFDEATGFFGIAMLTTRLFDDWLMVHVNVGLVGATVRADADLGTARATSVLAYWGVGLDVGFLHKDFRLIAEAYAGDPFVALGPTRAFQWGARWLQSDLLNLDLTFGAQPLVGAMDGQGAREYWAQIGVRILVDVVRSTPGDPMGAQGALRFPRVHGPRP